MEQIQFPKDFLWGSATASFQIEGAGEPAQRGESIWDRYCRTPGNILDGSDGKTACDHFHRFEEDVRLMEQLGLHSYRLSVSWPRILPEGMGRVHQDGLNFYKRLLECLRTHRIQPLVTLYHWDLPQRLQERGGWQNRETVDAFVAYAEILFRELRPWVNNWVTFNEPYCTAFLGHWVGRHAPGIRDYAAAVQVSHHLLLAHGKTVRLLRQTTPNAKIGIVLNMNSYYPHQNTEEDRRAAEWNYQAWTSWFADPIFKGGYPQEVLALYEAEGLAPRREPGDMALIHQPIDFLGLNHYFSETVSANPDVWPTRSETHPLGDTRTAMGWGVYPQGIHDLLARLDRDYQHPPIFITENGAAYPDHPAEDGLVRDPERQDYLARYLYQVHRAIREGVDVRGYYLWSLMDNFEWAFGYTKRFGIVYVDYATQARTVKQSGHWYANVIQNNGFVYDGAGQPAEASKANPS